MNNVKNQRWPFLDELAKLFSSYNLALFQGCLADPIHVVQPEKKFVFKFLSETHTIVVGSRYTSCSDQEILEKYLHEMVHMSNHLYGLVDVTSGDYHNKNFRKTALEVGFYVSADIKGGWSITTFDPILDRHVEHRCNPDDKAAKKLKDVIAALDCNFEILNEGKEEVERVAVTSARSKTYFHKYICNCPAPHNSIRSGRGPNSENPLKILCLNCNSVFRCETADGEVD